MYEAKNASSRTNAHGDPWISHRQNHALQMMEGNVAGLLHPVRKHGITSRCKDGDSSQHQILAKGHLDLKVSELQSFKVSKF